MLEEKEIENKVTKSGLIYEQCCLCGGEYTSWITFEDKKYCPRCWLDKGLGKAFKKQKEGEG